MKNTIRQSFLLFSIVILTIFEAQARTFIHPGISHKLSDLDRVKYMVQAGKEPWKTSFANLQLNPYASYNYTVKWSLDSTRVVEALGSNYEKFKYDALAAYYNALEWYITGDKRYADKSVEILNKMKNIRSIVSATQSLCAGRVLPKLMEAAEIIKSTYPGWKQADIDAFKAMLVYPGYSTTVSYENDAEHSFYWAMYNGDWGRHGNQGLFGMLGTLQIAIFSDNEIMYDRVVRYMRDEKHRSDDLPYVAGPSNVNSNKNISSSNSYFDDYTINGLIGNVADYGYNEVIKNYIWENGQTQEASRDQGHSQLALGLINNICEIAWNQGDDLYSILDYRQLLGWEYYFRYNLSYYKTFPDQTSAWEPTVATGEFIQRRDRSQRWLSKRINPWNANDTTTLTRGRMFTDNSYTTSTGTKTPMYEMALGHFKSRLNLPSVRMKWLSRADSVSRNLFSYERQGFQVDFLGFGSLTFHRADSCPGDPVTFVNKVPQYRMNNVPCKIEAEDYDYFSVNGQGRTFFDVSGTKIANTYRNDSVVTLKTCSVGGFKVSDIGSGEWLTYSVNFPEYSQYQFSVNYSAVAAGAKIKIQINGVDKTAEIALPATGADVWSDYTLPQTFTLLSGVQNVRVVISGASNAIELNSIRISKALVPANNDYVSYQSGDFNTAANWRKSDGNGAYQTTVPSTAPVAANNVWIQTGHTMTAATADVTCKNLVVSGTLTVGATTSSAKNIILGTSSAPGSLYIPTSGVLASTTANGSTVGTITVYGNTVNVDGRLGSVNTTATTGSGFRIICSNPAKTTLSGVGICNIVGLVPGSGITSDQEIVIDLNANLMNTSTTGHTLSLMNGDAGLGNKTLTINEGKTVTFAGGSVGLLHQMSSLAAQSFTGGDITYNILGTLDTGIGGLYLTTTITTLSPGQKVNVNVGAKGTLSIGSKFILIKSQSAQNINFNFASGATVKYSGTSTPVFSTTAPTGIIPATFPTAYSNLVIENPKGINLLSPASVEKSLALSNGNVILGANNLTLLSGSTVIGGSTASHIVTNSTGSFIRTISANSDNLFPVGASANRYDPAVINPSSESTFTVKVDTIFNVAPKTVSLTNPIEWTITSTANVSANLSLNPSTATAVATPVIAQVVNNAWVETDATISGSTFTAQTNSYSVFGTGSLNGFGLKSALNDFDANKYTVYSTSGNLIIKGLSVNDHIFVFNELGQQISQVLSVSDVEVLSLPRSGFYFVKLLTRDNDCKIFKIFAN